MTQQVLKVSNHTIHYLGYHKAPARAGVNIYEMGGDQAIVLISQPRDGYTGLSVTNGIERIVTHIHYRFGVPSDATFIEHYPAENDYDRREFGKPSFDLVTFTWRYCKLAHFLPLRISATYPVWKSLGQDGFSKLTGLDPEGV